MNDMLARGFALLLAAAAAVSLLCAIGFDLSSRTSTQAVQYTGLLAEEDDCIAKLPDTDVFVRLENLSPEYDGLMRLFYYRTNFMACPHRVLMGDPQVPFDYRHEPSNLNFNPTVPWLLAHNFGGEITLGLDRDHRFTSNVVRLTPANR